MFWIYYVRTQIAIVLQLSHHAVTFHNQIANVLNNLDISRSILLQRNSIMAIDGPYACKCKFAPTGLKQICLAAIYVKINVNNPKRFINKRLLATYSYLIIKSDCTVTELKYTIGICVLTQ